MNEIRKDASLHPKTITEFSQQKPAKRKHTPAKSSRVTRLQVDPRVWSEALRLAEGDPHRIQINNKTEVIILNPKEK